MTTVGFVIIVTITTSVTTMITTLLVIYSVY